MLVPKLGWHARLQKNVQGMLSYLNNAMLVLKEDDYQKRPIYLQLHTLYAQTSLCGITRGNAVDVVCCKEQKIGA